MYHHSAILNMSELLDIPNLFASFISSIYGFTGQHFIMKINLEVRRFSQIQFQSPLDPLLVPYLDGHIECPIIQFYIEIEFSKIRGRTDTYVRTEKGDF